MKLIIKISLILSLLLFAKGVFAGNIEGTSTYDNYLFVLVHGINSSEKIFKGAEQFGNLKAFLEKPVGQGGLGLDGRVYAYTFNDPNGSNYDHSKELADPSNPDNWFKRVKNDYKKYYAKKVIIYNILLLIHIIYRYYFLYLNFLIFKF